MSSTSITLALFNHFCCFERQPVLHLTYHTHKVNIMILSTKKVDALINAGSFKIGKIKVQGLRKSPSLGYNVLFAVVTTNPEGKIQRRPMPVILRNMWGANEPGKLIMRGNDILSRFMGAFSPDDFEISEKMDTEVA